MGLKPSDVDRDYSISIQIAHTQVEISLSFFNGVVQVLMLLEQSNSELTSSVPSSSHCQTESTSGH